MEASADRPQIGRLDVDPEALRQGGSDLGVVLATLGVDADDDDLLAGIPVHGWRVLQSGTENGVVLGAPVDDRADSWWIAQVSPTRNGTSAPRVTVHPDTFPLRDVFRLAIDVVNAGASRWRPNGDSFHVVGTLERASDKGRGFMYAFVGGQDLAFPLDAGEYVRVRVAIDSNQWRDVAPGRYNVHAFLAELGVRAETPLVLELTEELIERHRPEPAGRVLQARIGGQR